MSGYFQFLGNLLLECFLQRSGDWNWYFLLAGLQEFTFLWTVSFPHLPGNTQVRLPFSWGGRELFGILWKRGEQGQKGGQSGAWPPYSHPRPWGSFRRRLICMVVRIAWRWPVTLLEAETSRARVLLLALGWESSKIQCQRDILDLPGDSYLFVLPETRGAESVLGEEDHRHWRYQVFIFCHWEWCLVKGCLVTRCPFVWRKEWQKHS